MATLFGEAGSCDPRGGRRRLHATMMVVGVWEAGALMLLAVIPLLAPAPLPEHPDPLRTVLFYDPPPPPAAPLPRGQTMRPGAAMSAAPPSIVEGSVAQDVTPLETLPEPAPETLHAPALGTPPEPDTTTVGAATADGAPPTPESFGTPAGSASGSPFGMADGREGGFEGGLPDGVEGGVPGGRGTTAVLDYDAPPRLLRQTLPEYPHDAFLARREGTVVFEILIGVDGHVTRARLVESVPVFDRAARAAVMQWRFEPAVKRGRPVATLARAPVFFRLY